MEGGAFITYNDPRRFGFMDLVAAGELERHKLFAGLGPEPLGNAFDAGYLARRALGKATDLKAFLLDQRVVAGLGNIYVCEALHRAGLSPRRDASSLSTKRGLPAERCERLVPAIRDVLADAIAAGGSTLRDYRQADGALGYFQHSFKTYGREGEPCVTPGCRGIIRRIAQAGRSTFLCATCQR
jgi:formamidopyrimidine-DNA glycosylase